MNCGSVHRVIAVGLPTNPAGRSTMTSFIWPSGRCAPDVSGASGNRKLVVAENGCDPACVAAEPSWLETAPSNCTMENSACAEPAATSASRATASRLASRWILPLLSFSMALAPRLGEVDGQVMGGHAGG